MKLSSHFTLEEMTASEYGLRHGLDNTPTEEAIENLRALCVQVLEPLRWMIQWPIVINSGYRSPEINAGIGGSKNSQHIKGMAADIHVPNMAPRDIFIKLIESNILYDQVILEFDSWVHVSYNRHGGNRMERLVAHRVDNQTVYEEIWNVNRMQTPPVTSTSKPLT